MVENKNRIIYDNSLTKCNIIILSFIIFSLIIIYTLLGYIYYNPSIFMYIYMDLSFLFSLLLLIAFFQPVPIKIYENKINIPHKTNFLYLFKINIESNNIKKIVIKKYSIIIITNKYNYKYINIFNKNKLKKQLISFSNRNNIQLKNF